MSPSLRTLFANLILAATYLTAGKLGLALDAVGGFAALVWAPTGISLAALLLYGYGVWPGVAAGALLVNLSSGASLPVALGIACGNTLEALVGAGLLRRGGGFRPDLGRVRPVVLLILLAGGLATALSATVGVGALHMDGVIARDELAVTWTSWWLGDATAALVVTPLLLTWGAPAPPGRAGVRAREAALLGAVLLLGSGMIFLRRAAFGPMLFLQPYLLIAPLMWAALRFRTRGAATATFVVSAVAVAGTVLGRGPFNMGELFERLWALQAFIGLIAMIFLVLGALSAERWEGQRAVVRAKEAAEAASGAKSRFLAVMSHELRTPLSSIVGYADLLDQEIAGPLSALQRRHLGRIRAAAWHLVSIIDGILTFSRAEAGQENVELASVDARTLVDEVVGLLEPQASAKGVQVRAVGATSATMHTDPGKLRQILLNLAGNAVKYSDAGVVEVALEGRVESVVFRVRDQGRGIPEDQLEKIFEPFSQVLGSDASSGTGLGLSVSAMFARLLGGTLTVESRLGEGSTFTLTLPRGGAPPTPVAP